MRQLSLFEAYNDIDYSIPRERIRRNAALIAFREVVEKRGVSFADNDAVASRINKYVEHNTVEVMRIPGSLGALEVVRRSG